MTKNKTLDEYIPFGAHEILAFVRSEDTISKTNGNLLGRIYLGVLVCDRVSEHNQSKENRKVKFFHKSAPMVKEDLDISYADFEYDAKVVSEVPLAISTTFFSHYHLRKVDNERYAVAKELLQRHGLY